MQQFPIILSFSEILNLVSENTLVVLDIDETVLYYNGVNRQYWNNLFSKYYAISNDYDQAEEESLLEWTECIKNGSPKHTDKEGLESLFNQIKKYKADLIFLTARNHLLKEDTKKHFEELGFPNNSIIFYNAENKGTKLKEIIKTFSKDLLNIIFVDDLDKNLISVNEELGNSVKCFKFLGIV
jgi:hypothetical protein